MLDWLDKKTFTMKLFVLVLYLITR